MFLVKDFTNFTDKTTTLTVNFCNVVFCMLGRWPLCTLRLKLKLKNIIVEIAVFHYTDLTLISRKKFVFGLLTEAAFTFVQ